jgi:hypothetical protein
MDAIKYVTSVAEPSPDLLPLVQSLNPDFLFGFPESVKHLLCWLRVCSIAKVIVTLLILVRNLTRLPRI